MNENKNKNKTRYNSSGNGYTYGNKRWDTDKRGDSRKSNHGRNDRNDTNPNEEIEICAPYNFVPLPDAVVLPDWASKISQDVPFSDGISGSISLSLTALSPIFVRNGHSPKDAEKKNNAFSAFSNVEGRYFIPATSVKGAIRNILEIMTFGKMYLDKNARFAQREWYNKHLYTLKNDKDNIRCGWLKKIADKKYEIIDCGIPYRISHTNLERCLTALTGEQKKIDIFTSRFSNTEFNLNKRAPIDDKDQVTYDPKTAVFKYKLVEKICPKRMFDINSFKELSNRKVFYNSSEENPIRGNIVLTGQSSTRKRDFNKENKENKKDEKDKKAIFTGKFFEFVFPEPPAQPQIEIDNTISEDEFNQYQFIYAASDDWKYLVDEKPYGDKGIPVFYRIDKEHNRIKDWGLAYCYKLPYEKTPFETLDYNDRIINGDDMADCIFGNVKSAKQNSALKGRVQFSDFKNVNAEPYEKPIGLTPGSPKASYYPAYIDQEEVGENGILNNNDGKFEPYRTYNDGKIRGWKRYVRRNNVWGEKTLKEPVLNIGKKENKFTDSIVIPLKPLNKDKENPVFCGKIRFHNLKPEELGALLSAITFHGNQEDCRHLIGMGKPYGYGKVKVAITEFSTYSVGKSLTLPNDDIEKRINGYMGIFEEYMDSEINKPIHPSADNAHADQSKEKTWTESTTIKELMTLARFDASDSPTFHYMNLNIGKNGNEFEKAKKGNRYLRKYSEIIAKPACQPKSLNPSNSKNKGT